MLADGMESTRQIAAQMAPDRVETSQIQYGSQTLPQDGGGAITRALLRGERHEVEDGHDDNQLASAAVMTAADEVRTAGFDQPAVYGDLDLFATAVLGRGVTFCGPKRMALASWCANVATRKGVTLGRSSQPVRHGGW